MNNILDDDFDEAAMFGQQASTMSPQAVVGAPAAPAKAGNPLAGYFRKPGLHVKLPSGGAYLPKGAVELTMTGEVPVYPMRAADELLMKSPDALMSGYAIEKLVESCVPAIKTPRLISTPDLDVLLLAIRAASYGEKMEIEVACPKCKHEHAFDVHLPSLLSNIRDLPPENPVRLSPEVVAYVRPYNLQIATQIASAAFQETRRVQMAESQGEDAKNAAINDSFRRMTEMTTHMTAASIERVVVPESVVTDPAAILEFLQNIPVEWDKKIEEALKALNEMGMDKSIAVVCESCSHEWTTQVEFDPSSFFGQGS